MLTSFFSSHYEHQDFDLVTAFTFYKRLQSEEEVTLSLNKKSDAVILLAGSIEIYRPGTAKEVRNARHKVRNLHHGHFVKMGDYCSQSEVIEVRSDVIVRSKEGITSEILFAPTLLREHYLTTVTSRRIEAIMERLLRVFPLASKSELRSLAEHDCSFREYKMNSYLYRAGAPPKSCYVVVKGSVRVDSPGLEAKKLLETAVVSENTIFGQNDLN
jgi:hypothetical protein